MNGRASGVSEPRNLFGEFTTINLTNVEPVYSDSRPTNPVRVGSEIDTLDISMSAGYTRLSNRKFPSIPITIGLSAWQTQRFLEWEIFEISSRNYFWSF